MSNTEDKDLNGIEELIKERSAIEAPPPTRGEGSSQSWAFIETDWQRLKGRVHEHWPLLSDNEIDATEGDRERFVAAIQERYGLEAEAAEDQVTRWVDALNHPEDDQPEQPG